MAEAAAAGGRLPVEDYLAEGARRGVIWTALRSEVLHLIWSLDRPVGAYDAAARLSGGDVRVHPTSVYRCLHCLRDAGLVIPVVSWNRYLLTPDPAVTLWGLLLCGSCGACRPVDLSGELGALEGRVKAQGHAPSTYTIECRGRCRRCDAEVPQ